MELQEEKRVYVETPMFSGWGSVVYEDPNQLFGVQILLETPDEDGHRMKRVSRLEIKPGPEEVLFEDEESRYIAEAVKDGYHLRDGKEFIISSYRNSKKLCFYYDASTQKCLGTTSLSNFKNIKKVVSIKQLEPIVEEEITIDPAFIVSEQNGQMAFEL